MLRISPLILFPWVCVVLAASIGCGAVEEAREAAKQASLSNDLKKVGMAFHNYHDANGQGPAGWDEFIAAAPGSSDAIGRVRDAGYQMKWNVKIRDAKEGSTNFVLAESSSGGPKLFLDGSVRTQ